MGTTNIEENRINLKNIILSKKKKCKKEISLGEQVEFNWKAV